MPQGATKDINGIFIFFSALFVILLLPSALKIIPAHNPR